MLPVPTHIYTPDGSSHRRMLPLLLLTPVTALVGGGGKTSTMLALGRELVEAGERVTITTTTHIRPVPQPWPEGLSVVGVPVGEGKLGPVAQPDSLAVPGRWLLIEADGSRGRPAKAPAPWEPVLTEQTGLVLAVQGLTAVGGRVDAVCHRPERVCALLGVLPEHLLTPADCARLLLSPEGLYKGVNGRRFAVVLNQADTSSLLRTGLEIAERLPPEIPCILTSYR